MIFLFGVFFGAVATSCFGGVGGRLLSGRWGVSEEEDGLSHCLLETAPGVPYVGTSLGLDGNRVVDVQQSSPTVHEQGVHGEATCFR